MLFPTGIPVSKRIFDLLFTTVGGIIISPLLLILTGSVWLAHGSPVFFRQKRPGYRGKPFVNYKFRTMTDAHDLQGNLLPDEARLTRLGRFMRSTSMDELPELLNVLRGEMSWVGPRPLLMQYLERYTPEQARRQEVLPGITGWAQINGRNALDLGGEIPPGCLVRRPLVLLAGYQDHPADHLEGAAAGGDQPIGARFG